MNDFLSRLIVEDPPEPRQVTYKGETGTIHFRKISAGQREEIFTGLMHRHVMGRANADIEIDLGKNERQRQMVVMYSVCDESGKLLFKSLDDVKKIPHGKMVVLATHAEAVNRDQDEDLGKD